MTDYPQVDRETASTAAGVDNNGCCHFESDRELWRLPQRSRAMLSMAMLTYLFGITGNELSTWTKRGFPSLAGTRGVERSFGPEDREAVARVVFAKLLSTAGKSLEEAFSTASLWAELLGKGELPDMYVFNPATGTGQFVERKNVGAALMGKERPRAGVAGYRDPNQRGHYLFGLAMTAIDVREVVGRIDEAISGGPRK